MTELDPIYPIPPQPIDLTETTTKGENPPMSFWKTTGQVALVIALVGAGVYVAGLYHDAQADTPLMQSDTTKQADKRKRINQSMALSDAEERDLARIQKYCFGLFPWERDASTCKVWLRHYRELGEYSDGDLFKEELQEIANDAFESRGIERLPGNAQSPAN